MKTVSRPPARQPAIQSSHQAISPIQMLCYFHVVQYQVSYCLYSMVAMVMLMMSNLSFKNTRYAGLAMPRSEPSDATRPPQHRNSATAVFTHQPSVAPPNEQVPMTNSASGRRGEELSLSLPGQGAGHPDTEYVIYIYPHYFQHNNAHTNYKMQFSN